MAIRINCVYNDNGAWCKNKNVKRSLFGLGSRCCINYPYENKKHCKFKKTYEKTPIKLPPCPLKKEKYEKILVISIKY